MGFFKNIFAEKNPTIKEDSVAYVSGGSKTYTSDYNDWLNSVEVLDKAIRIFANVASMAKMNVYKDDGKGNTDKKPLKIKNVDLVYAINEVDSQPDFYRKVFSSLATQGASVIIAEKSKKTKMIAFYPYDPAKFAIEASESAVLDKFVYTSESGAEIEFKPDDVIYTNSTIDVTNLVYAVSRLKALNDLLNMQANIMKQTNEFYEAGSKDSVIISPKEPMSADNAEALKTVFNEFIQSRQTRTLFLNTDIDVQSVSNAQSPTDIMNSLTKINEFIIEAFGIPPYLYGNYAGYVNDAAVKTASRLFFEIQLKPLFKSFDFQMTKYFRNTLGLKNAVVESSFENIEILADSLETKVEHASSLYKLGLLSINEARKMVELEELDAEAANNHFLPAYLTGAAPVPIEKYDEMLASGFFDDATMSGEGEGSGTGASGGKDNDTELSNEDKNTETEE